MKAFVLAGGLGMRLRPRFGELPKPLAPVGGRPFLERPLTWLATHGVREVVLCVGYGADAIRTAIQDGTGLGLRVTYSIETEPLGTGGALRHAGEHLDGPALVLNGDTLLQCDPWLLEQARWELGALGAVALYRVGDAASRGRVECGPDHGVKRFVEKDAAFRGPAWVNGGLYTFSPRVWKYLPEGPSSLERDVLPVLAAEGRLTGLETAGEFFDIGTPEDWERADRRFAT